MLWCLSSFPTAPSRGPQCSIRHSACSAVYCLPSFASYCSSLVIYHTSSFFIHSFNLVSASQRGGGRRRIILSHNNKLFWCKRLRRLPITPFCCCHNRPLSKHPHPHRHRTSEFQLTKNRKFSELRHWPF